jgi:hypothetical protein
MWRFTVQEADRATPRRCFAALNDVEAYLEAELGQPGQHTQQSDELT